MFIYWLRLPHHTNILSEGYVGVSKRPNERFKTHKSRTENPHLRNCFEKYSETIFMDLVVEGSEEYCKMIESKLRPDKNIGWNIAVGGGLPPVLIGHNHNLGRVPWNKGKKFGSFDEETKRKRYENVRKPRTEDQKRSVSEKLSGVKKPLETCPYCKKIGGKPQIRRWHFENCPSK